MIASHLLFAFIGRLAPGRYPLRPQEQSETLFRRLRSALDRRRRHHPPPPYFNEHLCRDIGLAPPPRQAERRWPW